MALTNKKGAIRRLWSMLSTKSYLKQKKKSQSLDDEQNTKKKVISIQLPFQNHKQWTAIQEASGSSTTPNIARRSSCSAWSISAYHPREVDKYRNSIPYINHYILDN